MGMFILLQSADEALIHFDQAGEPVVLAAPSFAGFAESLEPEPRGFLGDADLFGHLHRTDTFPRRNDQIHRINPFVERYMRPLENRCRPHRKVQRTAVAAIETTLAGSDAFPAQAGRAGCPFRPKSRFQIEPCGFRIRDHGKQLERADCTLAHGSMVANSLTGVKYINPKEKYEIAALYASAVDERDAERRSNASLRGQITKQAKRKK